MAFKKRVKKRSVLALIAIYTATSISNYSYAMEINESKLFARVQKDSLTVNIVEDNFERKVVKVVEGNKLYITVFDKKNNTLLSEMKQEGITINSRLININHIENNDSQIYDRAIESVSCIYSKLKYHINMKSWTITNSKGLVKKKPETVSHKDNLYRFRDAVRSSRQSENAARAAIDITKLSIIMGSITATTGLGAIVSIVTALSGSIGVAYNIWDSVVYRKEADRYFAIL